MTPVKLLEFNQRFKETRKVITLAHKGSILKTYQQHCKIYYFTINDLHNNQYEAKRGKIAYLSMIIENVSKY